MTSQPHPLTPQQQQLAEILAAGSTLTAAAASLGIHRNTLRNWRLQIPALASEIDLAAREHALAIRDEAIALVPHALDVLRAILQNSNAPLALQLRAATTILKIAIDVPPAPLPDAAPEAPAEISATEQYMAAHLRLLEEGGEEIDTPEYPLTEKIPAQSCTISTVRKPPEPGRNSPCPCSSGLKYKRCCGDPSKATLAPAPSLSFSAKTAA